MKKKFTLFLFFNVLFLISTETKSQNNITENKIIVYGVETKSILNQSIQINDNTLKNKNLSIEYDNSYNKSVEDLIKKRQLAFDGGLSVLEFDAEIENQINNTNVSEPHLKAAPANDNCSNSVNITVGAPLICLQTTQTSSVQSGETVCGAVAGGNPETVWYRFNANNDSLVVSLILINNANCYPFIGVFGPFNIGAGCLPSVGNNLFCQYMGFTDPGFHKLLIGLTIGQDYLISIQGTNCGGPNDRFSRFCIGVESPASNSIALGSQVIDKCGTSFSGNTNIGNYPSGSSSGFNNLDNNNSTTVSGASQSGDDVNFVINNDSWFKFCPLNIGTWQISITGISGCMLPSPPNQGIQAAVFVGDPSNLTNLYSFPNPMAMGSSNISPIFSVTPGQCAYVVVDGFAGDACNYNLTLTNITGECKVLPIELTEFKVVEINNQVELSWITASEKNNDYYTLLKSNNAIDFREIKKVKGAGNSSNTIEYKVFDNEQLVEVSYYKLMQTDYDGKFSYSEVIQFYSTSINNISKMHVFWNPISQSIELSFIGNSDEKYKINITDITGRNIYDTQTQLKTNEKADIYFPVNNLQNGIYFVTVVSNNNKENRKFVIR